MFVRKLKKLLDHLILFIRDEENKDIFTKNHLIQDNFHIGDYTYGIPQIFDFSNKYHLTIGKFCSIGPEVRILIDGNHRTEFITTYPLDYFIEGIKRNPNNYSLKGDVKIGNDVWIGHSVMILPGISIGDGAVIGAGSVVTKDVKDYEIIGGSPACHIRFRFPEEQIKFLKKIQWWNWPIEKIKEKSEILQSNDIIELKRVFE